MKRTLLLLGTISLFAVGCAATSRAPAAVSAASTSAADASSETTLNADVAAETEDLSPESVALTDRAAAPARKPGDFVVYRFTGSFRDGPLTLTERVFARDDKTIVIDMQLASAGRTRTLRVTTSDAGATRGEVLKVERVNAGSVSAATTADYEDLMAQITLAADQNEATLGTEESAVEVGSAKLDCRTSSFTVKIGGKTATLRTIQSDAFLWGDVGGDITTNDGSVLYKAEVIEIGSQLDRATASLAQSAYED